MLLASVVAGLAGLAVWARFGGPSLPPSRAGFLILLATELVLLDAAQSSRPNLRRAARAAVVAVPLIMALSVRAYVAFRVRDFLDWDEIYYLSAAVTANAGRGLYPYVFGYGPMPIVGGYGYLVYVYVAVVHLAGPSIIAMRAVSELASIGGLVALWALLRSLYGSTTAWMGAALASALTLFMMSSTARMDGITFGVVMCGLLAVVKAVRQPQKWQGHLAAGLVFGLALQAHIDTIVTAIGCGVLYATLWAGEMRAQRRFRPPTALLWYGAGIAAGAAVYVCANILPDPQAYYRTTALVRLNITNWYSGGTASVAGSFLDPRILVPKELERYRLLWRAVSPAEGLIVLAAMVAMLVRRTEPDRLVATIIGGVVVATAVVLLNASPLYYIHVLPAIAIPLAPLLTHGLARTPRTSAHQAGFGSWLAFALAASAICASSSAKFVRRLHPTPDNQAIDLAFAGRARAAANPRCVVAGDAGLYIRHFPDYPYFISSRAPDVAFGMLYYGTKDEAEYLGDQGTERNLLAGTAARWIGRLCREARLDSGG